MIDELKKEADVRMNKAIDALGNAFNKIRTGRAHPSLLDPSARRGFWYSRAIC